MYMDTSIYFTMKLAALFLIFIAVNLGRTHGQTIEYENQEVLDELGVYVLRWLVSGDRIYLETTVATTGYIGLGLSKSGLMSPADFVIGWVSDREVYLGDYFTVAGSRSPQLDPSQDWHVQEGYEVNGTTVLRFYRDLDTCDNRDEKITSDTLNVIYAYHNADPDITQGLFPYHGADTRGTRPMLLLGRDVTPASYPPNNTFLIELRNYGFEIPAEGSRRQCLVHNLQLPSSHLIKYEPVISEGNERFVYRMILYRCNITDMALERQSFECENGAPVNVKACKSTVINWAIGTKVFHFPENAGLPLGGEERPVMFVLEIHYTNYEYLEGVRDDSGLRLFYTTNRRQFDAGLLELGHVITPGWRAFLPPGEGALTTRSHCSPRCLEWGFAENSTSVKAFAVIFQGNDLASSVRIRHFRGARELPYIAQDKTYSNFYQFTRLLNNNTSSNLEIWPTDHLSLECTYNTTARQVVTRGGWSRVEEVCRATVLYYPQKPLEMCLSWSSYDNLVTANNTQVPGDDAMDYLANITSWDPAAKAMLNSALATSTERVLCSAPSQSPAYAIDRFAKPEVVQPFEERSPCTGRGRPASMDVA